LVLLVVIVGVISVRGVARFVSRQSALRPWQSRCSPTSERSAKNSGQVNSTRIIVRGVTGVEAARRPRGAPRPASSRPPSDTSPCASVAQQ
jgi:hypothetical protein